MMLCEGVKNGNAKGDRPAIHQYRVNGQGDLLEE